MFILDIAYIILLYYVILDSVYVILLYNVILLYIEMYCSVQSV